MKRIVAALAVVLVGATLTACDVSSVNTTADGSTKNTTATIGQAISVTGNAKGSKIQVVVRKVRPTKSTDGFSTADKGNRLVAVQFVIKNTGTVTYSDAPTNGAVVVDQSGQQFDADVTFTKVSAGPTLPATVKLAPGNRALGFLVFQIPKKSKVKKVQFAEDSGFGGTAQWNAK